MSKLHLHKNKEHNYCGRRIANVVRATRSITAFFEDDQPCHKCRSEYEGAYDNTEESPQDAVPEAKYSYEIHTEKDGVIYVRDCDKNVDGLREALNETVRFGCAFASFHNLVLRISEIRKIVVLSE